MPTKKDLVKRGDFNSKMDGILDLTRQMLISKNNQYQSAYSDLRKEYPEYIAIRLTEKLNRLKFQLRNGDDYVDSLFDIIGYCILELIDLSGGSNDT